jgi:hypothetical protein
LAIHGLPGQVSKWPENPTGGAAMKRATASKKKTLRKPKPSRVPFSLIERKFEGRKFVEFPQMKGKTLDKVELFTTPEYHSISLDFKDKTTLALRIEPCFALQATYSDFHAGDQTILEEWLPVHSATDSH